MSLANNLKKYRKKAGLSQQKLAEKAGLSIAIIQKIESGSHANPSTITLIAICNILHVTIDQLVGFKP